MRLRESTVSGPVVDSFHLDRLARCQWLNLADESQDGLCLGPGDRLLQLKLNLQLALEPLDLRALARLLLGEVTVEPVDRDEPSLKALGPEVKDALGVLGGDLVLARDDYPGGWRVLERVDGARAPAVYPVEDDRALVVVDGKHPGLLEGS